MVSPPNTTPLLIAGLVAIPLALWKMVEIVVWFVSRLQWVSP